MSRSARVLVLAFCGLVAVVTALAAAGIQPQSVIVYRVEKRTDGIAPVHNRFTEYQLPLLEKLNRADLEYLDRLPELVVPETWVSDELAYSPLPTLYPASEPLAKFLVVHLPGQMFGAYESGALVRWGPVSSGGRTNPTPSGLFNLNWRSTGHTSTVDSDSFMPWYFNFGNREGLAFHEYVVPGGPASHGCVRLLQRDAQWLFDWGETWTLDASGTRVLTPGTPVFISGQYAFDAPPPWRSAAWLAQPVELPTPPISD